MSNYWHAPNIDPVLIRLWGPLQIRWYSLLYVGGFLVGRMILVHLSKEKRFHFTAEQMEKLIVWALLAAVIGARVVYCVVYDPMGFAQDPWYLFKIYQGGLSFHGAMLAITIVAIWFARVNKIPFWNLTDAMALCATPGLAMGRLGNFINGELYGRVTDVPWAMIFPTGGPQPRHPSQLYELFMEGILLFCVTWFVKSRTKTDGVITMVFLLGYSLARFIVEFFRQPDSQLGYLAFGWSMGQWLSVVMFIASAIAAYYFIRNSAAQAKSRQKR